MWGPESRGWGVSERGTNRQTGDVPVLFFFFLRSKHPFPWWCQNCHPMVSRGYRHAQRKSPGASREGFSYFKDKTAVEVSWGRWMLLCGGRVDARSCPWSAEGPGSWFLLLLAFLSLCCNTLERGRAHCYFSELCFQGKPWFVGLLPKDLIRMAPGNIALQRGT